MFFKKFFDKPKIQLPETIDLRAEAFFDDPYPMYRALRRERPLAAVSSGGYLLTRYQDVHHAFSSGDFANAPSRFSALHPRNREKYTAAKMTGNMVPFLDTPEHTRPRRALTKTFHPTYKEFAPEIAKIAKEFATKARQMGHVEVIHDIAEPFALTTMCRFLGLPETDASFLKPLGESFFYLFAPLNDPQRFERLNQEMQVFRRYFQDIVTARRKAPQGDVLSKFIETTHDEIALSNDEIVDNSILLFVDGVENIQYAIAHTLSLLSHHDVDFDRLNEGEDYLKSAIAEAIRLEPPAQTIPRIVRQETELHGVILKANTPLFLAIGSANRDETVFEAPDTFKTDRDFTKTLSFGAGKHSCIGGLFGTAQITEMVKALAAEKIKSITPYPELTYHHRFGHRWPQKVDVRF